MIKQLEVTFHGVRGSTPCSSRSHVGCGGNTSCLAVHVPGGPPILLDLGTGLLRFADAFDGPFDGVMFLTHLHWDHVQGLPFFAPLLHPEARTRIFGPPQESGHLRDVLVSFVRPPFFPVTVDDLPGEVVVEEIDRSTVQVGEARVTARRIPHPGATNGYRVEWGGASLVYIPDHQQPQDFSVDPEVVDLVSGADLLVHDSQYTASEFASKRDWGHCTAEYALEVARIGGVKRLALFHHDPNHSDENLASILQALSPAAAELGIEVSLAVEGQTVVVG